MTDFTIVVDVDLFPTAVLKGHVELADWGYNSVLLFCRCEEGTNITEAVNNAMDHQIGIIGSVGG